MWDPLLERIREIALHNFRAPQGSPPEEVRRQGDRLFWRGVLLLPAALVVGWALVRYLPELAWIDPVFADRQVAIELSIPAVVAAFAAIAIGGYRSILGKEPDAQDASSTKRIAVGVGVGCGVLFVMLPLFAIFIALLR